MIDTGLGMTAEQQAHLFEPFNRLGQRDAAVEGSGLRLVLTRRFIEKMGGRLEVQQRAWRGSRFAFELPRADPPDA